MDGSNTQPTKPVVSQMRSRTWRFKLVAGLIVAFSFLLLAELAIRLVLPDRGGTRFKQINQIVLFLGTHESDLMLEADPERFWKFKPNVRIEDPDNEFWQGHVSNSLGFRNDEFSSERQENSLRIVCFGDSSTFGIGNRMADTWPSQLAELVKKSDAFKGYSKIEVINAGVPGYTSYQGLQHMRQELTRLDPDLVLASYANNDFCHWDHTTDRVTSETLSTTSFRDHLMQIRIAQLLESLIGPWRAQAAAEQTPLPNNSWAKVATFNYVDPVEDWVRRVPIEDFRSNLNAMAELCAANGVRLAFVKWPDQPQTVGRWSPRLEYQKVITEVATDRNLEIADVVSEFQLHRRWSFYTYIPKDIVHVNRAGNSLAAKAAFAAVQASLVRSRTLSN